MSHLILFSHEELYKIDLEKVLYFLSDDHYTHVHYSGGAHFLVPYGLVRIEEALSAMNPKPSGYIRLGRKTIVNIDRVFNVNVSKQQLHLADDSGNTMILKIPKAVLRDLKDSLVAVMAGGAGDR